MRLHLLISFFFLLLLLSHCVEDQASVEEDNCEYFEEKKDSLKTAFKTHALESIKQKKFTFTWDRTRHAIGKNVTSKFLTIAFQELYDTDQGFYIYEPVMFCGNTSCYEQGISALAYLNEIQLTDSMLPLLYGQDVFAKIGALASELSDKYPDKEISYPGGFAFFQKHIQQKLEDVAPSKGRIWVHFEVDTTGKAHFLGLKGTSDSVLVTATKDLINTLPLWSPKWESGRKVAADCTIPIVFKSE